MEIAIVNKTVLRVKGKTATFTIDPQEAAGANAALMLDELSLVPSTEETVVFQGPGDYEVGGVKIVGTRGEKGIVYSFVIDGLEVLVGKLETLSAMQHKLKEHNIVIAKAGEQMDAAFITGLTTNVILFYGDKAAETAQAFEKENLKQTNKYSVALGKLPTEVETILLA